MCKRAKNSNLRAKKFLADEHERTNDTSSVGHQVEKAKEMEN